jgi:hypothetical protein
MKIPNPIPLVALLAAAHAQTFVGAGGCASSNCHGGTTTLPEQQSRILGNEYATWAVSDKHSIAYKKLLEPRGRRMAEILGIADATRDKRCAACHVAGSPEKSLSDGVACEACHGPAVDWLGPHTQPNSHAESVRRGMADTKDLTVRAKTCVACHVGAGAQVVDHEMIAAGHPDLAFELETFTAAEPAHHRKSTPTVRAWAVGQSVALAEGARLLAQHAEKGWPEFSDFEFYQCHHDLRLDSWRIARGYSNRKPGALQPNLARFSVLRAVVPSLDAPMTRLDSLVASKLADGAAIAQAARTVAQAADTLTAQYRTEEFDTARAREFIRAINAAIPRIADAGVNAAEQATMSLDALCLGAHKPAIAELYTYLEHPSSYKPAEFAALFRKAAAE